MMCFWISRTLNAQHDTDRHHQGFNVLLPHYCGTPQFQLLSAPVACRQARSNKSGEAHWRLPGALCQQGGSAAWGRGMQYNLLDLSEWPWIKEHTTASWESHALNTAPAFLSTGTLCLDAHPYKTVLRNCFTLPWPNAMQSSGKGWVLKILGRWPVEWNAKPIHITGWNTSKASHESAQS